MSFVSVVIPVFNRSHIIFRALNSVVSQTYINYEVIIVDDCSDDSKKLKEEVDKYNGKMRILYIRHETNLHGGAARNTGIEHANGEYIAFLDSDDVWFPQKLERSLDKLKTTQADFCYSKLEKVGRQQGVYPTRKLKNNEAYSDYLLVSEESMQTSTLVIKKDILRSVKFDPSLKRFQDYDLIVSLEKYGATSCFIDEILVRMYDDDQENRISNSVDPELAINWIEKVKLKVSHRAYANFVVNRIVKYAIYSGKKAQAMKYMFNSDVLPFVSKTKVIRLCLLALVPVSLIPFVRKTVATLRLYGSARQ